MKKSALAAIALMFVLTACGGDGESGTVATEVVYVDAQGQPVPAPEETVPTETEPQEAGPTVAETTTERPSPTRMLSDFETADGSVRCGAGELSGTWGGVEQRPVFGCIGKAATRGARPGWCSSNISYLAEAAAFGDGWVARGLCTGGQPFPNSAAVSVAPGEVIGSGGAVCVVESASEVSCTRGADGFRLSSTAVSATGNDLTE